MDRGSYQALPENGFTRAIKDASQTAKEFKARQRLSSASGQLNYLVQTANTWDLTQTLAPSVGTTTLTFEFILTADGTQRFPATVPSMDIRFNGTADANKPTYINDSFLLGGIGYESGSNKVRLNGIIEDSSYLLNPYVKRWTTSFGYQGTITYYMKPMIYSSSNGTLVVTRLT